MGRLRRVASALTLSGIYIVSVSACGAQPLETESARLQPGGTYELGTAFEFQSSSEGTETAVPQAIEAGVTNRFSLLVEPVPYTAVRPRGGAHATGVGDL